jgi:hypothetical protein
MELDVREIRENLPQTKLHDQQDLESEKCQKIRVIATNSALT